MITFLEYSYNMEHVMQIFKKMRDDHSMHHEDQVKFIMTTISPKLMENLPDGARADAALVFKDILASNMNHWNKLGQYVIYIWDQPISGPGKTLGKELLNNLSAEVMQETGSDFYISYSGELSKGSVLKYINSMHRVFVGNENYAWMPYKKVMSTITADYSAHFNNYRQKQLA